MKTLLASFLALFAACALMADDAAKQPAAASCCATAPTTTASENWDFVGVAFFPKTPPSTDSIDIYGVKLGLPVSFGDKGKVVGAELSLFASTTKNVKGFQGALLYNEADNIKGLQASPIVNIADEVNGVQAGLINIADDKSFQFGLINYIEGSSVPFFPIINFKF